jgi:hypothetical protein
MQSMSKSARIADNAQRTRLKFFALEELFGRQTWALALVLALVTFLVYAPILRGGFIWDDDVLITGNRIIKASDGLYRFWFTTEAPDYYPITWSLWWLEWRLWDGNATGYHVLNLLLHALNAVLVWMILRRLKIPGAWLAAMLFAIHPVNVATVAWISEQKNTLSMLFFAASIFLYLRFDKEAGWHRYGLSLAAFLFALLSKSAVAMLPVVLLGCVWWLRQRIRAKDLLRIAPFFALALAFGLVTIWFQQHRALGGYVVRTDNFLSRALTAGLAVWFYLYKVLLPFRLCLVYPKWSVSGTLWVFYLPLLMALGCSVVFWWNRRTWGRPFLFGLGYFVAMLFPVLGFFNQGFYEYSLVADHWLYYSIIGVSAMAAAATAVLFRRARTNGQFAVLLTAIMLMVWLAAATWRRAGVYSNPKTLWIDTLKKNPNAWVAHNNLGLAFKRAGNLREAMSHYERALQLKPDYPEAHANLGNILFAQGDDDAAVKHYKEALRSWPDSAKAHNNLGVILLQQGKMAEAMAQFQQAIRLNPDYAEARENLEKARE